MRVSFIIITQVCHPSRSGRVAVYLRHAMRDINQNTGMSRERRGLRCLRRSRERKAGKLDVGGCLEVRRGSAGCGHRSGPDAGDRHQLLAIPMAESRLVKSQARSFLVTILSSIISSTLAFWVSLTHGVTNRALFKSRHPSKLVSVHVYTYSRHTL